MYFSGKYDEVVYILVAINIYVVNDMDSGHYVRDVLYHNIGTWWNCDDGEINNYSWYPVYVYDNVSNDSEQKMGKHFL